MYPIQLGEVKGNSSNRGPTGLTPQAVEYILNSPEAKGKEYLYNKSGNMRIDYCSGTYKIVTEGNIVVTIINDRKLNKDDKGRG